MKLKEIGDGIYMVDVVPLGYENLISCYILDFEKKAVVETGPKSSIQSVFSALREIGIKSLDYIFVSHIHLDHAGGAGTLAKEFGGKIVAHRKGAKHIINPKRLWKASVEFSRINELYGKPDSVGDRHVVMVDEDVTFNLGEVELKAFKTEGHAPHHLSFFLENERILFSGDSAGMCIDGSVIPTTPSPFNLDEWAESVERMIGLEAELIAYTHFGIYGAGDLLERVLNMAKRWAEIASESRTVEEFSERVKREDQELRRFADYYSHCDVMVKWIDYGFEGMFEFLARRGMR